MVNKRNRRMGAGWKTCLILALTTLLSCQNNEDSEIRKLAYENGYKQACIDHQTILILYRDEILAKMDTVEDGTEEFMLGVQLLDIANLRNDCLDLGINFKNEDYE